MRCGHCGRKLIDAAIELGYCPSCGTHLANSVSARNPSQPLLVQSTSTPEIQSSSGSSSVPVTVDSSSSSLSSIGSKPSMPVTIIIGAVVTLLIAGSIVWFFSSGKGQFFGNKISSTSATNTPGILITPTSVATSTTTPSPVIAIPSPTLGYSLYRGPDGSFGLNYPSNWGKTTTQTNSDATRYTFISVDQSEMVRIETRNTAIDLKTVADIMQGFVTDDNGTDLQSLLPVTTYPYGPSNVWTGAQGSYMNSNGPQKLFVLAINHNEHGYIFVYKASSLSYNIIAGSSFASMISTFTFLS
jgi:hypothetical protein